MENNNENHEKKFFFKNMNNGLIYLILIIGVVLMVFSGREGTKKDPAKEKHEIITDEERLEEMISSIKGVGSADVMITYYETSEKNIAYDIRESDKTSHNDNNDRTVDRQAVITDGSPMIVKEVYPEVKGVIVAAQGASDINIKKDIKEAVQAALDVPAHRVCVYEKK